MKSHSVILAWALISLVSFIQPSALAQFSPFPGNTVDCTMVCSPECDNSGGGGDAFCELLGVCPPDEDCDPTVQSCLTDPGDGGGGDDGGGCQGADCGNSNPCEDSGLASSSPQIANGATGNPINLISGNKYKKQVDLSALPGVLGIEFVRHYNSAYSRSIGLGRGWRHTYSTILGVPKGFEPGESETLSLQQADGRIVKFKRVGGRRLGAQYRTVNHNDGYLTTTEYSYQWRWRDGRVLHFDKSGLLTLIAHKGSSVQLNYAGNSGRLISVTDSQSRRLSLHYIGQNLAGFTDPDGNVTEFKYDQQGRLVNVVRPDRTVRRYHYQDNTHFWNLTGITDERGIRTQSYGYDEQGRAVFSARGSELEKVEVIYDDESNTRKLIDASGNETIYQLEKQNGKWVVARVDGPGCSVCQEGDTSYEYNDSLQLVRISRKHSADTLYEYDDRQRLVAEFKVGRDGQQKVIKELSYEGNSQQPSRIKQASINPEEPLLVDLIYDDKGRMTRAKVSGYVQRPDGEFEEIKREKAYSYDSKGRLVKVSHVNPDASQSISIAWNERNLIERIDGPGTTSQKVLSYTKGGRISRFQINELPPVSVFYDASGNIVELSMGDNSEFRYQLSYDAIGNLLAMDGPNGVSIDYVYDDYGRLIKKTSDWWVEEFMWSKNNKLVSYSKHSPEGQLLAARQYEYDTHDRLVKTFDELGQEIESRLLNGNGYSLTLNGNEATTRQYVFDNFSELSILKQGNATSRYANVNGVPRLLEYVDSIGGKSRFGYDDFGNISFIDSPDSGLTEYYRDSLGRMTRKKQGVGASAKFEYGSDMLISKVSLSDDEITIVRENNTVKSTHRSGALTEQFSDKHIVAVSSELSDRQGEHVVSLEAKTEIGDSASGFDVFKTFPSGETVQYSYAPDGEVRNISLKGILFDDPIIDVEKQESRNQRLKGATDELLTIKYSNNVASRLRRVISPAGSAYIRSIEFQGDDFDKETYHYNYNELNQISGIDLNAKPFHRYRYDQQQSLTLAITPHAIYGYQYDTNNNRLKTGVSGKLIEYSYQENSNRLSEIKVGSEKLRVETREDGAVSQLGNLSFQFNDNGLVDAVYLADSGRLISRYYYNARAERTRKTVYNENGSAVLDEAYLYEDARLISRLDLLRNQYRDYVYLDDRLVALVEDGEIYAVHANHLGAPILVTDEDGLPVWRATYSPFGQAIVNSDPDKNDEAFYFNVRLPGQYEDLETRLYYNYYRYYEPISGRYLSSDPLGLSAGSNTYAYVKNDPVHYNDPLGLLLFAFDGTGNEAQSGPSASNVVHFRNAYTGDSGEMATGNTSPHENAYYITGAGTFDPTSNYNPPGPDAADAAAGGSMVPRAEIMFDYFLEYLELMAENQHWAGDEAHTLNVDTVGFSRGAATARLFANAIDAFIRDDFSTFDTLARIPAYQPVVDTAGFADRIDAVKQYMSCNNITVNLRFVGLFDTVSHYGLDSQDNDLQQLPLGIPSSADYAAHAVAANENRADFQGVSIHNSASSGNSSNRVELGFLGAHSDIGGGYGEGDLSDVALNWMVQHATANGLNVNLNTTEIQVSDPYLHSSEGVFPFVNSDRDFIYANGSQSDQAGDVAPNDSLLELINPQPTWSSNGAYGLNAEATQGMFDNSLMETQMVCSQFFCTEVPVKGEDADGNRTLIGVVDLNMYRQVLSQPPYNLNIVVAP